MAHPDSDSVKLRVEKSFPQAQGVNQFFSLTLSWAESQGITSPKKKGSAAETGNQNK